MHTYKHIYIQTQRQFNTGILTRLCFQWQNTFPIRVCTAVVRTYGVQPNIREEYLKPQAINYYNQTNHFFIEGHNIRKLIHNVYSQHEVSVVYQSS